MDEPFRLFGSYGRDLADYRNHIEESKRRVCERETFAFFLRQGSHRSVPSRPVLLLPGLFCLVMFGVIRSYMETALVGLRLKTGP